MRYIIMAWLVVRVWLSNIRNKMTTKFSSIIILDKESMTFEEAFNEWREMFGSRYKFKYDWGDWLRVPSECYKDARAGTLRDDCDGLAAMAYDVFGYVPNACRSLVTIVPTRTFWLGHTVCVVQDRTTRKWIVIDELYPKHWFDNERDMINAIRGWYSNYNLHERAVLSVDEYDTKWRHVLHKVLPDL